MTHLSFLLREPPAPSGVSEPVRAIDVVARPLVLVLEAEPGLSDILAEFAPFLRVDVECVPTIGALETALQSQHPIGLLAHTPQGDSSAWAALRAVSLNDPSLPVLLITSDRNAADGAFDQPNHHQPLTNLYWLDHRPGLRAIAEFLFLAERRGNMPETLRSGDFDT